MDIWITLGVVVGAVLIGWFVVPFLKSKGWFSKEQTDSTELVLELAKMVISSLSFKNKDKVLIAIEISKISVGYVEQIAKISIDNKEKKELAKDTVYEILTQMEIKVDEKLEKTIEVSIEAAVQNLPSKNK